MKGLNSYNLSRHWFDWSFENPDIINPSHHAIYFFAIEHCNRLGWKEKFGFPTQMVMDVIGIKKHDTYMKYFNNLIEWGFLILVQKSTNQYSSNIISLSNAYPKNGKALGKAILWQEGKQTETMGESIRSIDKPQTINHKQQTESVASVIDFFNQTCGTVFKPTTKSTVGYITARLKEGNVIDDLKAVIVEKHKQWATDDKMKGYLRPNTLFNSEKFEGYLNEAKKNKPLVPKTMTPKDADLTNYYGNTDAPKPVNAV